MAGKGAPTASASCGVAAKAWPRRRRLPKGSRKAKGDEDDVLTARLRRACADRGLPTHGSLTELGQRLNAEDEDYYEEHGGVYYEEHGTEDYDFYEQYYDDDGVYYGEENEEDLEELGVDEEELMREFYKGYYGCE